VTRAVEPFGRKWPTTRADHQGGAVRAASVAASTMITATRWKAAYQAASISAVQRGPANLRRVLSRHWPTTA
jgi:hypothetical protein